MSILFSDKYPVVVLAFRVRNRGSAWLDGASTGRIYVEKHEMEQQVRELIEENRIYDFVELLEAYKPVTDEGFDGFYGRNIHPMTSMTLGTGEGEHERHVPRRGRDARTLVLLDRGISMADPCSLWEQYPKIKVARFLANVVAVSHLNAAVYSFGESMRMEHSPDDVEPLAEATRLDAALRQVSLLEPERLVILTDKTVYVDGVDTESREREVALDELGRSGAQTLIITLGKDGERLHRRLEHKQGIQVSPLSKGGDLLCTMRRLAEWI